MLSLTSISLLGLPSYTPFIKQKIFAVDGVLFVYVVFKAMKVAVCLWKLFPVSVLGGNKDSFCVCMAKPCLVKRCYLPRGCSFYRHCFHLLRDWDFIVPFQSLSSFFAWVPSASFHTGTNSFLLALNFYYSTIAI